MLIVYHKYGKRLLEVKWLREAAKQASTQMHLSVPDRLQPLLPLSAMYSPWNHGQIQTLLRTPTTDQGLATLLAGALQSSKRSAPSVGVLRARAHSRSYMSMHADPS